MKLEMDVAGVYMGVDFTTATQFFVAKVRMKDGEAEVPIDEQMFDMFMKKFIESRNKQPDQAVRVEKVVKKQQAGKTDDDGFDPIGEEEK